MDAETELALAEIYAELMWAWWRLGAKLLDKHDPDFEHAGKALDRFQLLLTRIQGDARKDLN